MRGKMSVKKLEKDFDKAGNLDGLFGLTVQI